MQIRSDEAFNMEIKIVIIATISIMTFNQRPTYNREPRYFPRLVNAFPWISFLIGSGVMHPAPGAECPNLYMIKHVFKIRSKRESHSLKDWLDLVRHPRRQHRHCACASSPLLSSWRVWIPSSKPSNPSF
jgi:hypothetical protein